MKPARVGSGRALHRSQRLGSQISRASDEEPEWLSDANSSFRHVGVALSSSQPSSELIGGRAFFESGLDWSHYFSKEISTTRISSSLDAEMPESISF